jgi:hypothetical protein
MLREMAEDTEKLSLGIQRVARDLRLLEQRLLRDCKFPAALEANHDQLSLGEAVRGFLQTLRRASSVFGSRHQDRVPQRTPPPD